MKKKGEKEKAVVIIGAGIAGLATGCYAQMAGYRTRIFEMHDKPGGLCTAWKRKGYTFEGCLHHLAGSGPSSRLHRMWEELGAVQGRRFVYHEAFARVESPSGRSFTVYTDPERLAQHMKELSPADAKLIDRYTGGLRRFARFEFFALPASKPRELARALPYAPALVRWGRLTTGDFATRFTDPFLQAAFPWIQYDLPEVPLFLNMVFLAGCHNQHLGWPMGGSLPFAAAIARRCRELGGEIRFRSRVDKILTEAGPSGRTSRAVGVRLADGSEHTADLVLSAADGHSTIFELLEGKFLNERIGSYYAHAPSSQPMACHVSLGVARDMSDEPHAITLLLERPITLMGQARERLDLELFGTELGMAPPGKTAIKVLLDASYGYWKSLRAARERYHEEKERVAEAVIEQLDLRFPGLRSQIEVVDVATPVTIERYTGNWQGLQAWGQPGAGPLAVVRGLSKTLPGLEDFHMVGQWAQATIGISTAAIAARRLIEALCRKDGRVFEATLP